MFKCFKRILISFILAIISLKCYLEPLIHVYTRKEHIEVENVTSYPLFSPQLHVTIYRRQSLPSYQLEWISVLIRFGCELCSVLTHTNRGICFVNTLKKFILFLVLPYLVRQALMFVYINWYFSIFVDIILITIRFQIFVHSANLTKPRLNKMDELVATYSIDVPTEHGKLWYM